MISLWIPAAEALQSLGHEEHRMSYTDLSSKLNHIVASLDQYTLVWCDVPDEHSLAKLWGAAATVLQAARNRALPLHLALGGRRDRRWAQADLARTTTALRLVRTQHAWCCFDVNLTEGSSFKCPF